MAGVHRYQSDYVVRALTRSYFGSWLQAGYRVGVLPKVRGENTKENAARPRSLYSTSFEAKARLAFL